MLESSRGLASSVAKRSVRNQTHLDPRHLAILLDLTHSFLGSFEQRLIQVCRQLVICEPIEVEQPPLKVLSSFAGLSCRFWLYESVAGRV